jgi:serine/threonine protein kinase/WD40 repeat protein
VTSSDVLSQPDSFSSANRIDQICDAFEGALARGERPDLAEFLARATGGETAALFAELAALEIDYRRRAGESASVQRYRERFPDFAPQLDVLFSDEPIQCVGDYRLIREIGRGGMGVVYEAEQRSLGRRVALKVLPLAATLDRQQLQRFQIEARAAATLRHPNIVPVYSVGCEHGVHYYAMQLIEGQSLAQVIAHLRESKAPGGAAFSPPGQAERQEPSSGSSETSAVAALSTLPNVGTSAYYRCVARLGVEAAEALENAHANGVLHRDVKPANLLLDDSGRLWITDFGLAHLSGDAGLTRTGDIVGTLRYMSPEQALGAPGKVDHRTDIYSLGATLYELLTLERVHAKAEPQQLLAKIAFEEPRRLRQIDRQAPVDLETILAKAMERDPEARYASAREMAEDLKRFLARLPISAKPATMVDRLVKFSRRHHGVVLTAGVAFMVLSTLLIGSVALINRARVQAEAALTRTTELLYTADMKAAFQAWEKGWDDEVQALLNRHRDEPSRRTRLEWKLLDGSTRPPASFTLAGHRGSAKELAVFPGGDRLASVGDDGTLKVWDVSQRRLLQTIELDDEPLESVAISPDGRYVAAGSSSIYLCDVQHGFEVTRLATFEHKVESLAFGEKGACLVAGVRYHEICVLSIPGGEMIKRMPCASLVSSLQYVAKTSSFLLPSRRPGEPQPRPGIVQLWREDFSEAERTFDLADERGAALTVATASPDGKYVLAGDFYKSKAFLIETATGRVVMETEPSRGALLNLAFSPSGKLIALGHGNGVVEYLTISDPGNSGARTTERLRSFKAAPHEVASLRFIDEQLLATSGDDGLIQVWRLEADPIISSGPDQSQVRAIELSPDGKLAVGICAQRVMIIDAATGRLVNRFSRMTSAVRPAWSPEGERVAVCFDKPQEPVRIVDRKGDTIASSPAGSAAHGLAFSPTTGAVAVISESLKLVSSETGEVLLEKPLPGPGEAVDFSADGKLVSYSLSSGVITIADGQSCTPICEIRCADKSLCIRFSPSGAVLATGHASGVIRLWDVKTGQLSKELAGHGRTVRDIDFSADGAALVSAADDGVVRVWSVEEGQSYGSLYHAAIRDDSSNLWVCRASLSNEGRRLIVSGCTREGRPEVCIWSLEN